MGTLFRSGVLSFVFLMSGCAAPAFYSSRYEDISTPNLWEQYSIVKDPTRIALIEAELGSRGVYSNSSLGLYLGKTTAASYGKNLYAREEPVHPDKDCDDFQSSAEAQKYFLRNGGPVSDQDGLDRDGDGLACEWGVRLKRSARQNAPKPVYVAAKPVRSGCYVGPRGGTYTITSSGAKDYGGC